MAEHKHTEHGSHEKHHAKPHEDKTHKESHGKKLGDVPGNQTPNTPNKRESEKE